jgi:hypothetical protein
MRLNYKRITVLFLFTIFITSNSFAQNGYEVSVGKRLLNFKDSTVFVLEIDRAIEKDVVTSWKKALAGKNATTEIRSGQLSVFDVIIESVDDSAMDIHSTIVQQDTSVKLYSVFVLDGNRVDPKGKEGTSVKVRKLLASFGARVYLEVLERELDEKKDRLKVLTKEREKNVKAQDKAVKEIQKDSLEIGTFETDISLLKGELISTTERYNVKKNFIATTNFTTKDDAKEAKSELKELDKDRREIEKDIQKYSEEILDVKAEARDSGYSKKQLKEDLEVLEEKLIIQRDLVKRATEELKTYPQK